ncbi:YecA family protein [Enterococcus faecalis]|uniref:YecA family protein n=1 Tax=Enterococcus faecalis TaxID=1351 RepID=UPI00288D5C76|nr:SEC-C domain-containing protein [Enterococcus faecalis]MDT2164537.1 SEC-C domain-containing protein [Enterococcus faecalis]
MTRKKSDFNHIIFSNSLSKPMRNTMISQFSELYAEKTENIKKKISNIVQMVQKVNPIELMNFLVTTDYFSSIGMGSEIDYSKEQILLNRSIEYVQSLLVSDTVNLENIKFEKDNQEQYFYKIQSETIDLYNLVQEWYFYWAAHAEKVLKLDEDSISYIVESQLFSQVRGKRYQFQVYEHLQTLLKPLDELLVVNFNISADEVIKGLLSIEKSLTQERGNAISDLRELMDDPNFDFKNPTQDSIDKGSDLFSKMFGTKTNNVKKITNWPDEFIKKLSFSIGESNDFRKDDFEYWPILMLPIQKKPFIEINGSFYCFAYYNLFDNFYRIVQKLLLDIDVSNRDIWEQTQKNSSETAIEKIFQELLPKCKIFRDNYYPVNKSLKRMNENDIIIEYENSLIIVEVKAGSFSPIPAIINYKSHLKSYENLVEKASQQCQRTLDYLNRKNHSSIYDKNKKEKVAFQMDRYDYIYTMCVTIDDFNEFAAKAEKLNTINIEEGTIVISIEDLRTYKDYFDSPFIFFNYLENRKKATQVESLRLTDELDHLGMYIVHNNYPKLMSGGKKKSIIQGWGYRQELDEYFMSLWTKDKIKKPEREMDALRQDLLYTLEKIDMNRKLLFSNLLLDFSTSGAHRFCNSITSLKRRQKELKRMLPVISASEDVRYVMFLHQPGIKKYPSDLMIKYCDSMLAYGNYSDLFLIQLYVDSEDKITNIKFDERKFKDIHNDEMDELLRYGKDTFNSRLQTIIKNSKKKKIGRNDYCPCGSGLKYKKCCGK